MNISTDGTRLQIGPLTVGVDRYVVLSIICWAVVSYRRAAAGLAAFRRGEDRTRQSGGRPDHFD